MRRSPVALFKQLPGSTSRDAVHCSFLRACLNGAPSDTLTAYFLHPMWDWETLVRTAAEQQILPLLCKRLSPIESHLPIAIRDVLRSVHELHSERNELMLDELAKVALLANQIGVEPVVLKGAAYILAGIYPDAADRYLLDLDLLIPEAMIQPLVCHLLNNGYDFDFDNPVGVDCHHEMSLKRAGRPSIELHRSLGMGRCKKLLRAGHVLRDAVPLEHRGARLRIPTDEHLLIHHVLHTQLQNSYRQAIWPSLRDVFDCVLLTGRLQHRMHNVVAQFWTAFHDTILEVHFLSTQDILDTSFTLPSVHIATRVRVAYRRVLRAMPRLRFIDPTFFFRSSLLPRFRRLADIARERDGLSYILATPFRSSFYRNVLHELFALVRPPASN